MSLMVRGSEGSEFAAPKIQLSSPTPDVGQGRNPRDTFVRLETEGCTLQWGLDI